MIQKQQGASFLEVITKPQEPQVQGERKRTSLQFSADFGQFSLQLNHGFECSVQLCMCMCQNLQSNIEVGTISYTSSSSSIFTESSWVLQSRVAL
jgi:hypothetical protein